MTKGVVEKNLFASRKNFLYWLSGLDSDELSDLNRLIVSEIKERSRQELHDQVRLFKAGDYIRFKMKGVYVEGIVLRCYQKSIKVLTTDLDHWNLSPHLLERIEKPSSKLIKFKEQDSPFGNFDIQW